MQENSQTTQKPAMAAGVGVIFNENDPKYRCLGGICHVVTASKIFLGLYVLVCLGIGAHCFDTGSSKYLNINVFTVGFPALIVAVTIFAFLHENSTLMIPFVIQSVAIFGLFLFFGFVYIACFFLRLIKGFHQNEDNKYFEYLRESSSPTEMALRMLIMGIAFIAILHFLHWQRKVVFACQEFFEKKAEFKAATAVASQSVAAQQYDIEGGIKQPLQAYMILSIDEEKQEPTICY